MKDFLIAFILASLFTLSIVFVIVEGKKLIEQGVESVEGEVLAVKKGTFRDCLEISKTTKGESAIVSYCVWEDVNLPKVGNRIELTFTRSALVFKDSMKIKVLKEGE